MSIKFKTTTPDDEKLKQHFLEFLNHQKSNVQDEYLITIDHGQVILSDSVQNKIALNFNDDMDYHRVLKSKSSELISRAVGAGKKGNHILDLTAGLGVDAISLVRLGYSVVSVERNPLVFLALEAAYDQWTSDLKSNLTFIFNTSGPTLLQQLQTGLFVFPDQNEFTVAYYDPMFPQKKKSALPRQEMVLLQKLTGEDPDANHTLTQLIQSRYFKRLVVKRPLNAETVLKPTSQLKGKLIRYDIYDQTGLTRTI